MSFFFFFSKVCVRWVYTQTRACRHNKESEKKKKKRETRRLSRACEDCKDATLLHCYKAHEHLRI